MAETILAEARQHWMALIRFALQPILVFLAAIGCYILGVWLSPSGDGLFDQIFRWLDTLLGLFTLGLFILALVLVPHPVRPLGQAALPGDRPACPVRRGLAAAQQHRRRPEHDHRRRRSGRHSWGGPSDFADLVVATAANRPLQFRDMRNAIDFKKAIMAAQQGTVAARADQILARAVRHLAGSSPSPQRS